MRCWTKAGNRSARLNRRALILPVGGLQVAGGVLVVVVVGATVVVGDVVVVG